MTTLEINAPTGRGWNIGLWIAQIALAMFFGMTGYSKSFLPPADLVNMGVAWASQAPLWLIRFIGVAELAGAVGLILPALTRVQPKWTTYAAVGLAMIQALALCFHIASGEFAVTPFNAVLLSLALFIMWGRFGKAPIAPRS